MVFTFYKTLKNLKQFNDVLRIGCVVVDGIPTLIKSSAACLQVLNWPSLSTRQSYFAIAQVHDILHKKSPSLLILTLNLGTIILDPISAITSHIIIFHQCLPLFIVYNSLFLWNSIPFEILQIAKSTPFRLALCRFFLFKWLSCMFVNFVFCNCFWLVMGQDKMSLNENFFLH